MIEVQAEPATHENVAELGTLLVDEVPRVTITIDHYHYGDSVVDGQTMPLEYRDPMIVRTARIHPRHNEIHWLERHTAMNQLFLGLGSNPFAMVLAPPTDPDLMGGQALPRPEELKCLIFSAGSGILLKKGTWHDFPMALERPVTCMTVVSQAVVSLLAAQRQPRELSDADILKLRLAAHYGEIPIVRFD